MLVVLFTIVVMDNDIDGGGDENDDGVDENDN